MRGEQFCPLGQLGLNQGSPPLARGTDVSASVPSAYSGITPACAGNRLQNSSLTFYAEDHPRLRGEQLKQYNTIKITVGSPPLARGTVIETGATYVIYGITPACAGNSSSRNPPCFVLQDHPRLRGEQAVLLSLYPLCLGSPPLARGTV